MKSLKIIFILFSLLLLNLKAEETITGKVLNTDGRPVKYATVILPNGSGAECDSLGNFYINYNYEFPLALKISAVDYVEKSIAVTSKEQEIIVFLENKSYELDNVVVTTSHSIKMKSNVAAFEIKEKEIAKTLPLHIGEVLQTKAGFTIRSGYSSPLNLRGMSAKRMLILKNGIRYFSSYNSGFMPHTINANDIEKVEVEKGASTIKYGAGAMAGIINFIDKTPFSSDGFNAKFFSGVAANNNENNLMFSGGWSSEKFAAKFSIKQRRADNFHYSNGIEAKNSFYNDKDYSLTSAYNISNRQVISFNASLHDGGPWGKPKGFNGSDYMFLNCDNEHDKNFSLNYSYSGFNTINELNASLFYSKENRKMTKKYFTAAGNHLSYQENTLLESSSMGTKITALFNFKKNLSLSSGIEIYSMKISSPVNAIDYLNVFEFENRVSKNARVYNYGMFTEADLILFENLVITTGLRYDASKNYEGEVFNTDQNSERSSLTDAFSATFAFKYFLNTASTLKLNLSKSIRIPDPTELFVDSYTMNGIIYANPDLKPESSHNVDITYNYNNSIFDIELCSYIWFIKNLISKEEFRYLPGTYYIFNNIGKSRLWGFEATASTNLSNLTTFNEKISISSSITYTNGTDVTNSNNFLSAGSPLDYIPPLNIKSQISYSRKFDSFELDLTLQNIFYTLQTRLPESGYATPAYCLTNLFWGFQMKEWTFNPTLRIAVNNFFNIEYYSFQSYLPSMGRDIRLFVTLNFGHS